MSYSYAFSNLSINVRSKVGCYTLVQLTLQTTCSRLVYDQQAFKQGMPGCGRCTWFFEITAVQAYVCLCVCVCERPEVINNYSREA